jgi:hypothetical protein
MGCTQPTDADLLFADHYGKADRVWDVAAVARVDVPGPIRIGKRTDLSDDVHAVGFVRLSVPRPPDFHAGKYGAPSAFVCSADMDGLKLPGSDVGISCIGAPGLAHEDGPISPALTEAMRIAKLCATTPQYRHGR